MTSNKLVADIEHAYEQVAADGPTEQLEALLGARNLIDWYIERAVVLARTQGEPYEEQDEANNASRYTRFAPLSWRAIGEALGISKSAAYERFRELS